MKYIGWVIGGLCGVVAIALGMIGAVYGKTAFVYSVYTVMLVAGSVLALVAFVVAGNALGGALARRLSPKKPSGK
jgi:hypothetical protein